VLWAAREYYSILKKLDEGISGILISRCCVCGIHFLTSNSNRGRRDLRCPFGCRVWHRRLFSIKRSLEYYQTEVGREKKKDLNKRRSQTNSLSKESHRWSYELLLHLCLILNRLEKRKWSLIDVGKFLDQVFEEMRQHSLFSPDG